MTTRSFESAVSLLPQELQNLLLRLPQSITQTAQEIRLRANKPLMLTAGNEPLWIASDGAHRLPPRQYCIISKEQIDKAFMCLCQNSVYSHEEEIKQGFIALRFGHRAGVCGTYTESGMIKDVCSINLRIAREVIGCANKAFKEFDGSGMLIAGPPACGKTTILRDMVRQMSLYRQLRVCVVDTRFEIAASVGGIAANNLGDTVDVLSGYEKADGIEIATRTLNPQVVAFDELGNEREIDAVISALNCGVCAVATIHAGNATELQNNCKVKKLINAGAIKKVILLPRIISGEFKVLRADDFV